MKPNFALILSLEGIALLQRAASGWELVGEVSPESETLSAEMSALREAAEKLAPGSTTFKIVIPNDQIRYVSVAAGPADPTARQRAVELALDGQTPYALDEMAIDHCVTGRRLQIAAVALETLQEADEFARGYGFTPVSFAAMPQTRDYSGEPYFGTAHDVPPDIQVEPDAVPIRVSGRVKMPIVSPEPPAEPAGSFVSRRARDEAKPAQGADGAETAPSAQKKDAETASEQVAPAAGVDARNLIRFADGSAEAALSPPLSPPETDFDPAVRPTKTRRSGSLKTLLTGLSGAIAKGRQTALASSKSATGAWRRSGGKTLTLPKTAGVSLTGETPVAPTIVSEPAKISGPAAAKPRKSRQKSKAKPALATAKTSVAAKPTQTESPAEADTVSITANHEARGRDDQRAIGALSQEERKREAERLTVFGARNGISYDNDSGNPAIVLGIVLAVFLLGTAGWAAIFLNEDLAPFVGDTGASDEQSPEDRAVARAIEDESVPPGPTDDEQVQAPPLLSPSETSDQSESSEDPPVSPLIVTEAVDAAEDAVPEPTDQEQDPDPATTNTDASRADGPEAAARYAATGIWQQSPDPLDPDTLGADASGSSDTSGAEGPPRRAAVESLAVLTPDALPAPPGPAPIPGRRFNMDDRGLVIATPEGAETPSGVIVYQGDPPLLPPTRPGTLAGQDDAALSPSTNDATDSPPEEDVTEPVRQATASPQFRPRQRPQSLIVEAVDDAGGDVPDETDAAEIINVAAIATPPSDTARGSVAAGLAAGRQPVTESEAAAEEVDLPEAEFLALRPLPRPGNIATLAAAAQVTQQPPPVVVPSVPSAASVTRQATVRNAINLRQINLIGVYGQPSDRRALVRLSNGRYRKVKIGDRIDGGRVLAIGDASLRYQKNGRNLTLDMPSG